MKIKTEQIKSRLLTENDIKLYVKRIDLIDKYISGNKWYKLKYNIESAINNSKKCVLTFGGAYSNHLLATAVIANKYKLKSIGLVRGEKKTKFKSNTKTSSAIRNAYRIHFKKLL